MKSIKPEAISRLPGIPLKKTDTFNFRCHKDLACFNQCCRNLNLFLYPFDVLRLSKCLDMDSDRFLETHVDVLLREGNYFPLLPIPERRWLYHLPGPTRYLSDLSRGTRHAF